MGDVKPNQQTTPPADNDIDMRDSNQHTSSPGEAGSTSIEDALAGFAKFTLNDHTDNDLLAASFQLFRFMVGKARALIEEIDPTSTDGRNELRHLDEISDLIDKVERDNFLCFEWEGELLDKTFDNLLKAHADDPEVRERIDAVLAKEDAMRKGGDGV